MHAPAEPIAERTPLTRWLPSVTPAVEFGVLAVSVAVAITTYFVISGGSSSERLLTPPLVALLLVANLLPGVALLVLIGRRVAKQRARKSGLGGERGLHVRLVAIFSVLASVPTLLLAVFASLLFQYGVEFWFSDRARGMLENASSLARQNYDWEVKRVRDETLTMRQDLLYYLQSLPIDSKQFQEVLAVQLYQRELSEALIVRVSPQNTLQSLALVNPYERDDLEKVIKPEMIAAIDSGQEGVEVRSADRIGAFAVLDQNNRIYIYAARVFEEALARQMQRAAAVERDYGALRQRSRALQLQFHAALLLISLLIVCLAVFVALAVADRLVRPLGELVEAAGRVAGGDLAARVPDRRSQDEVGTLSGAFNKMTERLQQQTNALVTANAQIESRRALIEAVMSGVSAGVVSIGADRGVRLINQSAMALLGCTEEGSVGRPLAEIAPELDTLLDGGEQEAVIQLTAGGDPRTLAVKVTSDEGGQVLTFDDITQQLLDQRRAAWSDVARRIAHEIKNPLTPIQLAAERLQRRYGKQIEGGEGVFARLTDTIVRQVGDLRRIVDEFSSFARMPKPLFRQESLLDIARQAMFLHEVAHPAIRFALNAPEAVPTLVCDRRQIGQALTNVIKNAVEAIEGRGEGEALPQGEVILTIEPEGEARLVLTVVDNGVGLPAERDRLVEPYMTTRARGTGLGLAIVKKIVEEHFGTISFSDRAGGGTVVSMCFDAEQLAAHISDDADDSAAEPRPDALTRTGK